MAVIGGFFVMFAPDVVGSASLITADEEGILERLKAHQNQFVYPKIAQYDGRIISAPPDGLLVEFSSPIEAVRCAVEVQRGMINRSMGTEPEWQTKFRVGIDIGKPTSIGEDLVSRAVAALPIDRLTTLIKPGTKISGDHVTMATGIAVLADPDGICVSRTIQEGTRDQMPFTFQDIGKQDRRWDAGALLCHPCGLSSAETPRSAAQARRSCHEWRRVPCREWQALSSR
jgi:adenylate cyclase